MTPPGHGGKRRARRKMVVSELSERDLAILGDLARLRLLAGRLIERLHFADGSPLTAARKSRSSLQRLYESGLIVRLERRIGGIRAGSSGFVYGLSAQGQKLVETSGPAGGKRLRRPWEPSRLFAEHVLATSELYVQLREAERAGELELLAFQAEPAAWRHWNGHGGETKVLKPDCFVQLATGNYEHARFVEIDRATESLSVISRKARVYVDYWQSGMEQRHVGMFPKVLWLTTNQRRAEQLIDALARLDAETWQLFQVGLLADGVQPLITN
jgi:Replication-relaxation